MEKIFNRLVMLFSAVFGWTVMMTRRRCGWKGQIFETNSANTIIYRFVGDDIHVLIQKHPHRNMWEVSGGGVNDVEKGFNPSRGYFFATAGGREVFEEIGLSIQPQDMRLEASFQQRVPTLGCFCHGCAWVYSYHMPEEMAKTLDLSTLPFQRSEVSEVRWVPILECIEDTSTTHVGLGYRRMLLVFLHRFLKRQNAELWAGTSWDGEKEYRVYEGRLGTPITFHVEGRNITV